MEEDMVDLHQMKEYNHREFECLQKNSSIWYLRLKYYLKDKTVIYILTKFL